MAALGQSRAVHRLHGAAAGPVPVGPYSQATRGAGLVFVSGQIPAVTGLHDQPGEFREQVRQALRNLAAALHEMGSTLGDVLKVNAYLTDRRQLTPFNEVYAEFFGSARPARTTVCVDLWDVALEVECVAVAAGEVPR